MEIPFFKTTLVGNELDYVSKVLCDGTSFSSKNYIHECEKWFATHHGLRNFFLTKSCTQSLELAAILLNITEGDEVIMPSYAFVSCGNAFALRGATCVYVDVHPDTMCINASAVKSALSQKTKAIVTINYAGNGCDYVALRKIAEEHSLFIIEDNAHGTGASMNGQPLGTFGDVSCFSFDHLKNIGSGQGGGIGINNKLLLERFFITYEFGTNRRSFFQGKDERYEWKNIGLNAPLSELNAAMLFAQLESSETINNKFRSLWNAYQEHLASLRDEITLPPHTEGHNAHCFFIKTKTGEEREELLHYLNEQGIHAQFHYQPLHTSSFGKKVGRFAGEDFSTTAQSSRLIRLPLFFEMDMDMLQFVVDAVKSFYTKH